MIERKPPKFSAKNRDPWWLGIEELADFIGVKRDRLDQLRIELGHPCEHRVGRGAAAPVYIYAPLWLQRYVQYLKDKRRRSPDQEEKEKFQARNARLDYWERRGRLVDADKLWKEQLEPFCDEIRTAVELTGRVSSEAQRIMRDGLNAAILRLNGNANGHATTNGKAKAGGANLHKGGAEDTADAS